MGLCFGVENEEGDNVWVLAFVSVDVGNKYLKHWGCWMCGFFLRGDQHVSVEVGNRE